MNSIYNRTDEESSVIGEVQDNFIANYPLYQQGFKAGAASRDAKIQRLQSALADAEALELGTAERCDQLRAQIKMLRDALQFLIATKELKESIGKTPEYEQMRIIAWGKATVAITSTPEQFLAEYRNKVIEAFLNEFSRHVGGDGEFWLHELQDFAMKEQP